MMAKTVAALASLVAVMVFTVEAQAQIELSIAEPIVGQEVTITLAEPADALTVTYRPNSGVVKEVTLKAGSPSKAFAWTPDRPGIVKLSAGSASKNLSVRFGGFPWSGLLIMLFAAGILFGGAGFAFRILFGSGKEGTGEDHDASPMHHPDT